MSEPHDAFAAFYDQTCVPAYRLAQLLTDDGQAAAALLRRAYLEAWRRPQRQAASGLRPLPWLLGLVHAFARESDCGPGPAGGWGEAGCGDTGRGAGGERG